MTRDKGHYVLDLLKGFPDVMDDEAAEGGLGVDDEEDDGDATSNDECGDTSEAGSSEQAETCRVPHITAEEDMETEVILEPLEATSSSELNKDSRQAIACARELRGHRV